MIPVSEIGPLLITVPELGDVSDADEAQTACVLASGAILDYIGRPILEDTYTHTLSVQAEIVTREQEPNGMVGVVRLKAHPVTAITSVVLDGQTLAASDWSWDAFAISWWSTRRAPTRRPSPTPPAIRRCRPGFGRWPNGSPCPCCPTRAGSHPSAWPTTTSPTATGTSVPSSDG